LIRRRYYEQQIRERLEGNYDRTTFYRSFKVLQECRIIHKIVIDNQFVKYALDNTITHKSNHGATMPTSIVRNAIA